MAADTVPALAALQLQQGAVSPDEVNASIVSGRALYDSNMEIIDSNLEHLRAEDELARTKFQQNRAEAIPLYQAIKVSTDTYIEEATQREEGFKVQLGIIAGQFVLLPQDMNQGEKTDIKARMGRLTNEQINLVRHKENLVKFGTYCDEMLSLAGEGQGAEEAGTGASAGGVQRARVLYDYEADDETCITIAEGGVVVVTDTSNADWWWGYNKGEEDKEGHFPASYVEIIQTAGHRKKTRKSKRRKSKRRKSKRRKSKKKTHRRY